MNTDTENYSDSSDESDYTENEEEVQVLTIPKNIVELPKSIEKLIKLLVITRFVIVPNGDCDCVRFIVVLPSKTN